MKARHAKRVHGKGSKTAVKTQSQNPALAGMIGQAAEQAGWGRELKEGLARYPQVFEATMEGIEAEKKKGGDMVGNPNVKKLLKTFSDVGHIMEMGVLRIADGPKGVPVILLQGQWLEDAGFLPGEPVRVKVNPHGKGIELAAV